MDYTNNGTDYGRVAQSLSNAAFTLNVTTSGITEAIRNLTAQIREARRWQRQKLQVFNDDELGFAIQATTANGYPWLNTYMNYINLSDVLDGEWIMYNPSLEEEERTPASYEELDALFDDVIKKVGDKV